MRFRFDDLRLRTKSLIPLAVMYVAVFGMAGFGAYRLNNVSQTAEDVIEKQDKTAIYVARAAREAMMGPYSVMGAMIYAGDSPEGRTAQADFSVQIDALATSLKTIAKSQPDYESTFGGMQDSLKDMKEQAKIPLGMANDFPGLSAGRDLKPEMLDKLAKGVDAVAAIDSAGRDIATGLLNIDDEMISGSVQAGQALTRRSHLDLIWMAAAALVSAISAGALMAWVTTTKIARPLAELAARAKALAEGDLDVEIRGGARKDEIGEIARAILEFQTHARERIALEKEASAARRSAEGERERNQTERGRLQADQAQAIRQLGEGLHAIAGGDLGARIDQAFASDYEALREDFNEAAARLERALGAVASASEAIRSGARNISDAAGNVSQRTESQAASLEETAASIEEISATMRKSAAGAADARDLVGKADSDAKHSADIVRRAVEAMGGIAGSAQQISQIIVVIDEIAFQTNLLALNAGVEAARAGESGRGFAVVASEVRALAQRSADAAKEIKQLIQKSGAQVEVGVQLVDETGQALERIVGQVSQINQIVNAIASGAREQAAGLESVNAAVSEMDKTTQENAELIEQSATAARELVDETDRLAELVAQFRLNPEREDYDDEPYRAEAA